MILCNSKHFVNIGKMREDLYAFLTLKIYFPFCMWVYKGKGEPFPLASMLGSPEHSLAKRTGIFLRSMQLEPMPGYEDHDMKHTLLGYGATLEDEVAMQYFEWANGNRSLPVITVILFGTLIMPEKWTAYQRAFKRGREALPLKDIRLKEHALTNLLTLQTQWNITPKI